MERELVDEERTSKGIREEMEALRSLNKSLESRIAEAKEKIASANTLGTSKGVRGTERSESHAAVEKRLELQSMDSDEFANCTSSIEKEVTGANLKCENLDIECSILEILDKGLGFVDGMISPVSIMGGVPQKENPSEVFFQEPISLPQW